MTVERESGALGERLLGLVTGARTARLGNSRWAAIRHLIQLKADTPARLFLIAAIASLCGTGVLYILNAEAKQIEQEGYNVAHALLFVALLVVYRVSQLTLIRRAADAIEEALDEKRKRAVDLILALSLRDLEQVEKQSIRDGLSAHYGAVSQTLVPLISGVQSLILLLCMFVYLVSLSPMAAGITVGVLGFTIIGYSNHHKRMMQALQFATESEGSFRRQTDGIIGGAKELQLSKLKRLKLKEAMFDSSAELATSRSKAAWFFADLIATGTSISYFLAGIIVFILPIISGDNTDNLSQTVIAIIFILGPIGSLVQSMQHASTAQFSLNAINDFEIGLEKKVSAAAQLDAPEHDVKKNFESIELSGVNYQHDGEHGFAVSDINLRLNRGEILFLTGGNGSGKTTLLRVLTGLYPRSEGTLSLNSRKEMKASSSRRRRRLYETDDSERVEDTDESIRDSTVMLPFNPGQEYRELFSSVFADFYLFDGLYGLSDDDIATLEHWLDVLKIRDKLRPDLSDIHGDHLSTGQRKRLALALSLTEGRPILVLDEWAADQDPQTRRWFYEELLPRLRSDGFTCFIITHDESYFRHCDRRLHMVEGRLQNGNPK